jgi:hypothetical protein
VVESVFHHQGCEALINKWKVSGVTTEIKRALITDAGLHLRIAQPSCQRFAGTDLNDRTT